MSEALLCGLDPGREKFGLAVGNRSTLAFSAIAPVSMLAEVICCLEIRDFGGVAHLRLEGRAAAYPEISEIFLGNGTGFRAFADRLERRGVPFTAADESFTTLEGRSLYWRLHPPRGLWRFVPVSLRVPPRSVDDMAAWAVLIRASRADTRGSSRQIGDDAFFSRVDDKI
ncbi:MAG: endonuclease [Synergistaceae bacterium]|jgi:RNase H-fold protein (predicted Holliday junction resolvase)|nr:endonuclease [Synergistaceae bacterium]